MDEPLIEISSTGTLTYLHADRQGSIIAATNSSGAVVNEIKYGPYGEFTSITGTTFAFTGQRYDAETGLFYYKGRHYSSMTGRFLQTDPLRYLGGSFNLYKYAKNDPLNWLDPSGLSTIAWYNFSEIWERAQKIAHEESAAHTGVNDCDDAMRHAEWSKRMSEDLGWFYSFIFGAGHEYWNYIVDGSPWEENLMDMYNNAYGINSSGYNIDPSGLINSPDNSLSEFIKQLLGIPYGGSPK